MTYDEWFLEFKGILRNSEAGDHARTLKALDHLMRRTRRAARASVSEWQEGEVLGFRATVLDTAGRGPEAAREYLRLAAFYRAHLRQFGHAVASALEVASSTALRHGDHRVAFAAAAEVFRLRSQFPDASRALEDLVRAFREVRDKERKRAKDRPRRKRDAKQP